MMHSYMPGTKSFLDAKNKVKEEQRAQRNAGVLKCWQDSIDASIRDMKRVKENDQQRARRLLNVPQPKNDLKINDADYEAQQLIIWENIFAENVEDHQRSYTQLFGVAA